MKVDQIIKNAKIFTSDKDNLHALTQEHEGFSQNKPADVYFGGKRMNENR